MAIQQEPVAAVLNSTKGSRVWYFSNDLKEWAPGKLLSVADGKCHVQLDNGAAIEVAAKDSAVVPANPSLQDGVDDVTQLSHLNEPAILYNLKHRFDRDLIYTFAGSVLIALNPFKDVALCTDPKYATLYREKSMEMAFNEDGSPKPSTTSPLATDASNAATAPHIFQVAAKAFQDMKRKDKSQALVISGESGAGKTESTKMAMQYFAGLSGGGGIEAQVLQSNPVLEAFGNAKTKRNHNSSRFGKLIQIHFTPDLHISGATIKTFLLEKSRVVKPQKDERSYHIFYQLIRGSTEEERKRLHLPATPEAFRYLAQSECMDIPGVDDAANYQSVKRAMGIIGISNSEQDDLMTLLSGTLWLGNVEFEPIPDSGEEQYAQVAPGSEETLATAAGLLGLDTDELRCALVTPRLKDRRNTTEIKKQLTVPVAEMSRDALAKAVYSGVFDWLVQRISSQLAAKQVSSSRCISILDIFGFEDFGHNSFEQLCINYANERLQCLFNKHLFKLEQEEYEREGLPWELVSFTDNQPVLDCLDINSRAHQGVLVMLDEACKLSSNDQGFRDRMQHAYGGLRPRTKIIEVPKLAQKGWDFAVSHFAGTVKYSADSFTEKNKDKVGDALVVLMQSSTRDLVRHFADELGGIPGSNMANKTVWSRFKVEMEQLMGILESRAGRPESKLVAAGLTGIAAGSVGRVKRMASGIQGSQGGNNSTTAASNGSAVTVSATSSTDVDGDASSGGALEEERPLASSGLHFVRCIKPNNRLQPGLVEGVMFLEQLRWGGVVEVARIASKGFPTRYPVAEFNTRYHVSIPGLDDWQHRPDETPQATCERLLLQFGIPEELFMVGRTKLFFRAGILAKMEDTWSRLHKLSSRLQSCCSTWAFITNLRKTQRASLLTQCNWRQILAARHAELLRRENAARTMQQVWRACTAHKQVQTLKRARCIQNAWRGHYACNQTTQLRAAFCIQSAWRACIARKELSQLQRAHAALRIQCAWRRHVAELELLRLQRQHAAHTVQRYWRGSQARAERKHRIQQRAAKRLQTAWRRLRRSTRWQVLVTELVSKTGAASLIQRSWRYYHARSRWLRLKNDLQEQCKLKAVPDVEWVMDPIKTTRNMNPISENGITTPETSSTPTFSDSYSVRSEPSKAEPYETVVHRRLEAAVNSSSYGPPGADMRRQLMQRVATVAELHCGDPYAQGFADCIVHLAEGSSRLEDELMNLEHMCSTSSYSPSDHPGLAGRLSDLQLEFKKFVEEFKGNIECIRDMTARSMLEEQSENGITVDIVAECKLVKKTFALWEVEFEERLKEVKPVAMRSATKRRDAGVRGSADGLRLSWLGSLTKGQNAQNNARGQSLFTN